METLQTILQNIQKIDSLQFWSIVSTLASWLLATLCIIIVIKVGRKYRRMKNENFQLRTENAHILKVTKGMCLRKAAISKEIIDDLNLRKTAIGEALRVVRENNLLKNNHPDILKMIADEIYSYLTSKQ
jgi:hypothetical protein